MPLSNNLPSRASPSPSAKSSRFSIRPGTTSNGRFSMLRPSSPMWGASAPAPAAPSTPAASPTTLVTAAAVVEAPSPTSPPSAPLCIRCKCELNEEDLAAAGADAQQPPSTPANQVTNLPVASAYVPASPASPSPRNLVQRATKRLSIDLLTRRSARPLDTLKTDDISSSTGLGLELGEAAAAPTASVSLDTQHQQVAVAATPTRSPAKKLAGWLRRSPSTLLSSLPSPALTSSPLSLKRVTSPSLFDVPSDPFSATPTTPTGELRRSRAVSLSASVGLEVGWREEEAYAADRVSTATYDTILSRTQARPATPPAHALRASRSLGALSALDAKQQQQQQQRKGAAYKKINNNVDSDTDVHSLSSSTATSSEYGHPTEYSPSPSSSACSDAFEFDEYAEYLRYGGGLDSHTSTTASSDEEEEESSTSDDDDESNASDETTTADSPLIKQRMRLHHNSVPTIVNSGSNGENELNTVPFPLTPPAPRQLLLFSRLSPSITNGGETEEGNPSPIEEASFTSFNSRVIPLSRRSTKQLARASTPVTQGYALKPLPPFPNDIPSTTTTTTKRGNHERPRTAMDLSTIRPTTHLKPLILHAPSAPTSASATLGITRSPSRTVGYGTGAAAGRGYARPALTPPVGLRQMRSRARALSTDA